MMMSTMSSLVSSSLLLLLLLPFTRASLFSSLNSINLDQVYQSGASAHLWGPEPLSPVPVVPAEGPGGSGSGLGTWALDFTWNDTVVWVTVDPLSAIPSPALLKDKVLGISHDAKAQQNSHGVLLGVNISVEECVIEAAEGVAPGDMRTLWKAHTAHAAPSIGVAAKVGGSARPDYLTLGGLHGGFLRVPSVGLWTMINACPRPSCTYSVQHGAPAALSHLSGSEQDKEGTAFAVATLARAGLSKASPSESVAFARGADAAIIYAGSSTTSRVAANAALVAFAISRGSTPAAAAVAANIVLAAAPPPPLSPHAAAVASAAHLPQLSEVLSTDLIYSAALRSIAGARTWFYPNTKITSQPLANPWQCEPGARRVVATEWRTSVTPFQILARLALDNDGWLWEYSASVATAEAGWDVYLRALTLAGGRACLMDQVPEAGADACVRSPSTLPVVKSPASWVALSTDAMQAYSAGSAAVHGDRARGDGKSKVSGVIGKGGPPTPPPQAAAAAFFTLAHWWPGYETNGQGSGARPGYSGSPALVSYLVSKQPPRHLAMSLFGDAWVIALYMIFAGIVIFTHAVTQCVFENRYRKRFEEKVRKHDKEKRSRQGSAASAASILEEHRSRGLSEQNVDVTRKH